MIAFEPSSRILGLVVVELARRHDLARPPRPPARRCRAPRTRSRARGHRGFDDELAIELGGRAIAPSARRGFAFEIPTLEPSSPASRRRETRAPRRTRRVRGGSRCQSAPHDARRGNWKPAAAKTQFHHRLVHPDCRREDAGAHIGTFASSSSPARAVLAIAAVEHREDDVQARAR